MRGREGGGGDRDNDRERACDVKGWEDEREKSSTAHSGTHTRVYTNTFQNFVKCIKVQFGQIQCQKKMPPKSNYSSKSKSKSSSQQDLSIGLIL